MNNFVLDCERMKYPHTGLYHYCRQLGLALQPLLQEEKENLSFYVRPGHQKVFGESARYIEQRATHKFIMPVKGTDVWHCTYQSTNYFPSQKKLKVVLTVHDLNILHENKLRGNRLAKELKKIQRRLDRADHVVAISEFTLSDIRQHLRLNKPASVIYNGCNFQQIDTPTSPAVEVSGNFLFTLGTINAKKNFHVLACLLEGNLRKLVIAGVTDDEVYKATIIAAAEKYGASDRLIFAGAVSENDKQWFMANCEAFVFPSLAEGFGLPVIEAMFFGKPVIISDLTALPEIGGDAAFYFRSFEPAAMQRTLQESLDAFAADPSARQKAKDRAAMFSWDTAAAKYLAVYRGLAG